MRHVNVLIQYGTDKRFTAGLGVAVIGTDQPSFDVVELLEAPDLRRFAAGLLNVADELDGLNGEKTADGTEQKEASL